jgi:hypothetical protein
MIVCDVWLTGSARRFSPLLREPAGPGSGTRLENGQGDINTCRKELWVSREGQLAGRALEEVVLESESLR